MSETGNSAMLCSEEMGERPLPILSPFENHPPIVPACAEWQESSCFWTWQVAIPPQIRTGITLTYVPGDQQNHGPFMIDSIDAKDPFMKALYAEGNLGPDDVSSRKLFVSLSFQMTRFVTLALSLISTSSSTVWVKTSRNLRPDVKFHVIQNKTCEWSCL